MLAIRETRPVAIANKVAPILTTVRTIQLATNAPLV
jgi:hypothetical protein